MENVETFYNKPEPGVTTYVLAGQEQINIPNKEFESEVADACFLVATAKVAEMIVEAKQITSDLRYSELGRNEKLEPIQAAALEEVAHSWDGLRDYEENLNSREEAILMVHKIDPSHAALAIEDREIRDWWRALPMSERADALRAFQTETKHSRIMLALLRSPVAMLEQK